MSSKYIVGEDAIPHFVTFSVVGARPDEPRSDGGGCIFKRELQRNICKQVKTLSGKKRSKSQSRRRLCKEL